MIIYWKSKYQGNKILESYKKKKKTPWKWLGAFSDLLHQWLNGELVLRRSSQSEHTELQWKV